MPSKNELLEGRLFRKIYSSPVGALMLIASERGLRAVLSLPTTEHRASKAPWTLIPDEENEHLNAATRQLDEYFAGQRQTFDLELEMIGTDFQIKAWQALQQIPFGQTRSYQQQAQAVGSAKLARAVGGANSKNPIGIIVPCHRVIGKSGNLTGFTGGLEMKRYLINLETKIAAVP